MIIRFFIIIAALFTFSPVFSQQRGLLTGVVQNINTGKALSGVKFTIDGLSISTISDTSGYFRMSVPVGTYKVSASLVGYIAQLKYNI